ncbi:MAG: thioesterase family protein [Bacteroidota bacterium]
MGRVKIKFPNEKALDIIRIPVRITDINYGNHLGNDSLLSIIHEARMSMLADWGFTELDAGGNSLIMADVMIAYKSEAYYGDVLDIHIYAEEITERSFDLLYQISAQREGKAIVIAHAKTGMVCYDYEFGKIALMKEGLKGKLQRQ